MAEQALKEKEKHILLVEDTKSLAYMYQTSLEEKGYKVDSYENAIDALNFLSNNPTDLILLDLKLPDMDGLTVMNELSGRGIETPVIMITGHGSVNTAVEAIKRGARDFLVKPFDVERLFQAVEYELERPVTDTSALHDIAGGGTPTAAATPAEKTPHSDQARRETTVITNTSGLRNFGGFIGTSPIMLKLYDHIEAAAKSNATVFITGESGTGKEVCAEAIHKHSPRADKPFVPINCAAIPRDLMESELFGHVKGAFTGAIADRNGAAALADGGTLFLDEIAEMNPDMQTKLLRFIQNLTFMKVGGSKLEKTDVRIICATNRNPLDEVKSGQFREDLFYRLHVLPIYMPPLRQRGDDVIDIAQVLLSTYAQEEHKRFTGMTQTAEDTLRNYPWPGNIRQLQNVMRNIVVLHDGELVTDRMLPPELLHQHTNRSSYAASPMPTYGETMPTSRAHMPAPQSGIASGLPQTKADIKPLEQVEYEVIQNAIKLCGGNIPQAAAALGVSPSTIYRKKASWDQSTVKINPELE